MHRDRNGWWALIAGTALMLLGILGFLQDPLFGILGVNAAHNGLHLILGAALVAAGAWGGTDLSRKSNLAVGTVLILLGLAGSFGVLVRALDLDPAGNILHVIVGAASIAIASWKR